jgi:hypothetical protein
MNCQTCQEKIVEALAAGTPVLPPEVAAHRNSCRSCDQFYETQRNLFASIDAELRSLVNPPVPPSLLPRVRSGLDAQLYSQAAWLPILKLAAIPAIAVLALSVAYSLRTPRTPSPSTQQPSVATRQNNPEPSLSPLLPAPTKVPRAPAARPHPKPADATSSPEVIVLAEEREAFARFVSEVPDDTAVAVALTCPAEPEGADPVEIALLQIAPLQLKPLVETSSE